MPPGGPRRKQKRKAPRAQAETYETVLARFFDGDMDGALGRFAAMAAFNPGSPDGHAGLGLVMAWAAEGKEALRHLEKARKLGDERPYTLLGMGDAYKWLGMDDEAVGCYRGALAGSPGLAAAHANLAYFYAKRGMHAAAVESADEARRHDPESAEAAAVKGVALLNMGMRKEAGAVLGAAERDYPESDQARLGAAYALLAAGDAEGFLGRLEGLRCIEPGDPEGRFKRGRKLAKRGDHAGAYREYAEAARLEPISAVYAAMAASLVRLHDGDPGARQRAEALAMTLEAIGTDPLFTSTHIARIYLGGARGGRHDRLEARLQEGLDMLEGDLPGALSRLRAIASEAPGFAGGREALGQALLMSGDAEGALAEYKEAVKLGIEDTGAYNNMGNVYDELKMYKEAEECYKLALRGPAGALAHANLAQLCLDQGRHQDALEAAGGALKLDPKSLDAHIVKGEALFHLERLPESIRSMRKAVKLSPGYFWTRLRLGQLLSDVGGTEEALRYFDEAARLEPDDPIIHHERGVMLSALKRLKEAREAYAKSVELGPLPRPCANLSMMLLTLREGSRGGKEWRAEALALADRAVEMDPDYAFGYFAKSRLLADAGMDAEAEENLLHAQMLDPEFVWDRTSAHLSRNIAERKRAIKEAHESMEFRPGARPDVPTGDLFGEPSGRTKPRRGRRRRAAPRPRDRFAAGPTSTV